MRFNPKARLDRGRVQDTGQGSGGSGMGGAGMRLPIPGGVGGGVGGIIVVVDRRSGHCSSVSTSRV